MTLFFDMGKYNINDKLVCKSNKKHYIVILEQVYESGLTSVPKRVRTWIVESFIIYKDSDNDNKMLYCSILDMAQKNNENRIERFYPNVCGNDIIGGIVDDKRMNMNNRIIMDENFIDYNYTKF